MPDLTSKQFKFFSATQLLGDLYEKRGELKTAINYYLQVKEMAERAGQLESAGKAAKHLDSLYVKTGDFQMANKYNSIYAVVGVRL